MGNMDSKLREEFFSTMMSFKKLESAFSTECEMQINEMMILHKISGNCCDCPCTNLDVPEVQEKLHISKPAVSYILNTLEKKNYIVREIDAKDRRKISISPTPEGKAAAEHSMRKYDEIWDELLHRFGENNMQRLIELLTDLNELYSTLGKSSRRE